MKQAEFLRLTSSNKKVIETKDLTPYLSNRTLLYGYTCSGKTFHVYLKNQEIHTVVYDVYFEDKIKKVKNIHEFFVERNIDYIPDTIYPEASDFTFCRLLQYKGISLPFTTFNQNRSVQDFYGFTLEDEV